MVDCYEVKLNDRYKFCLCAAHNRNYHFFFYVLPVIGYYRVGNITAFLPHDPLVFVRAWGGGKKGKSDLNTTFMFMQKILSLLQLQLK